MARMDLTGKRYGRLVVEGYSHSNARYRSYWHCKCDCGETKVISIDNLRSGNTTSCGCFKKERFTGNTFNGKHGHSTGVRRTPTYLSWASMIGRCTYPSQANWKYYGGAGIEVCERWRNKKNGFENFLADMGERPEDKTLDRIDPAGNYEPENCRWATRKEQAANKRPYGYWMAA